MGKDICPQCGHGVAGDEDGCCGLCGADLVTPEVAMAIADDRAREIAERLRGPGCVVDGSEVHTDCDPCNLCGGVADWIEAEYLTDKKKRF